MTTEEKYYDYLDLSRDKDEKEFFEGLASLFDVSHSTAMDIWYSVQRSWFRTGMIDELIRLDKTTEWKPVLTSGEFVWKDGRFKAK
jgi:hypothetical protein